MTGTCSLVIIWDGGVFLGRRYRIEYEGAIYHVIQRGNNKEFIFNKDEDKEILLNDIFEKKNGMGVRLISYVIMSNHFHLVLQTMSEPLSRFMHRINNKYSKYYNKQYCKSGHVFEGRYKSIPVQNENYLLTLIRYVHQNPQRAGICENIQDYMWSSDYCYRNNINEHVDIEILLDTISTDRKTAIRQYIKHMQEVEDFDYTNINKIGDESFNLIVEKKEQVNNRKRLNEILMDACSNLEEYELIKQGSRKRCLTQIKKSYIKSALALNYTLKEIGNNIKLSDAAVYKLIS